MFGKPLAGLIVMTIGLAASASWAESPKPFPEFSAKRIKPPAPGAAKRITVWIEPKPEKPAVVPEVAQKASGGEIAGEIGGYPWFWEAVSPDIADTGPGRLDAALQTLAAHGGVAAPRLQTLHGIAAENAVSILTSTVGTRVSPALVLAVIAVESAGRADAVSTAGAQGLMQLMPDTAERFGVADVMAAADNIAGGVKYLDWLMDKFDGDPVLVLAGYNAGAGAVRDNGGVPPYPETRDYVPKVLAAFQVARGLCKTPPELISDGCVFALQ